MQILALFLSSRIQRYDKPSSPVENPSSSWRWVSQILVLFLGILFPLQCISNDRLIFLRFHSRVRLTSYKSFGEGAHPHIPSVDLNPIYYSRRVQEGVPSEVYDGYICILKTVALNRKRKNELDTTLRTCFWFNFLQKPFEPRASKPSVEVRIPFSILFLDLQNRGKPGTLQSGGAYSKS